MDAPPGSIFGRNLRPLRVLFTNENRGFGGGEVHNLDLARGLLELGVDLRLLARRGSWLAQEAEKANIPTEYLGMRNEIDPVSLAGIFAKGRKWRAEILHSFANRDMVLAYLAGRWPKVVRLKSELTFVGPNRSHLCNRAYHALHGCVCPSLAVKRQVMETTGIRDEQAHVIYLGMDFQAVQPGYAVHEGVAQGRWIGYVASLIEGKGHKELLQATALLRGEFPDVGCALAGGGPLRPALEEEAKRLGLADCVRFLGFVPDSLNVLSGLEVVVVPSFGETFSIVTLEAMALGKPVVATRVGGIPEVLGEAGTLLEPGRPDLLAEAIGACLRDPERAARHGQAGRERALGHFTRRQMLEEHLAYYERMLAISRPGGR